MQPTSVTCLCVCVSGLHGCLLSQVPPAPLPASMWKKSQIPLPLSPGGLVLIITVQLLPTPSRLEPLSPSAGKLLAQVGLLTSLHWSKHLLHSFLFRPPAFFSPIMYRDFLLFFYFFMMLVYAFLGLAKVTGFTTCSFAFSVAWTKIQKEMFC